MELQEFLTKDEPEQTRERFVVENKDQAVWAMRKIAKAKAEIEENNKMGYCEPAGIYDTAGS